CGMPNDFGVPGVDSYVPLLGNTEQWESNNVIPGSFGGTGVPFNRDSMQVEGSLFRATHITYYAHVEKAGYALPHGYSGGTYGAEWCTSPSKTTQHGWDCDDGHWYVDASTGARIAGTEKWPVPGTTFQSRDVDCYDWTLVAKESGVSPTNGDVGPRSVPVVNGPNEGCACRR